MIMQSQRVTAKEAVINSIEQYIITNELKPGMGLPSEHELSKKLNVSRNILREGLQYFKTLGIIDSKPKTGAYIKRLAPKNIFGGYMPFMRNNDQKTKEIGQVRMIIELGMIPLLINSATAEDLDKLDNIAQGMANSDSRQRQKLECEFHGSLMKIVDNELLSGLSPLLIDFFEEYNGSAVALCEKKSQLVVTEHLDIVKALRAKDGHRLSELIQAHYMNYCNIPKGNSHAEK
jgi:GntR family transcriptional regulator, transcriptional repressor for pyruvate dehydrogenase complex